MPTFAASSQDRPDDRAGGVGQAVVAAVVGEGQPGVVEAEQVQDRGVQVVDVDADRPRRGGRPRRSRRGSVPPLTPPPAIQLVNPCGLWSRPLPLSDIGIRPNSPPQMTSVLSSSPRRFRSLSRPATGLSVRPHIVRVVGLDVVVGVPAVDVARVELDEPDAALDQPPGQQAAGAELGGLAVVEPVEPPGLRRSRATGRRPRGRRIASGRPARTPGCAPRARRRRPARRDGGRSSRPIRSSIRRWAASDIPSGGARSRIGRDRRRASTVPWWLAGKNPAP